MLNSAFCGRITPSSVFTMIMELDKGFPKNIIREMGQSQINVLSWEMIKYLRHRIGRIVDPEDTRGKRRLQCDDAGWVKFSKLLACNHIAGHLSDGRSRSVEGIAATCVKMLREEVRRHATSRYSIICWRAEDRDRFGEEYRLGEAELDWIFNHCYGLDSPVAVCATYNHTPFHLWPIDEEFAGYTVIRVGQAGGRDVA